MSKTTAPSYDGKGLLGVGIPDGIEESVQEVYGERGGTVINIAAGYQTRQVGSAVAGAEVGQAFAVGVDTAAGATGRGADRVGAVSAVRPGRRDRTGLSRQVRRGRHTRKGRAGGSESSALRAELMATAHTAVPRCSRLRACRVADHA